MRRGGAEGASRVSARGSLCAHLRVHVCPSVFLCVCVHALPVCPLSDLQRAQGTRPLCVTLGDGRQTPAARLASTCSGCLSGASAAYCGSWSPSA